uniref:Uncharacterized protein n=1 Tax=Pristionchus pacificus TaxID=54126 RepID=A0A2A6D0B7_PRIPA|eukprot:PDM83810.1 hypothetical protein PRIPAC_30297 [Pristionchus pacificus]
MKENLGAAVVVAAAGAADAAPPKEKVEADGVLEWGLGAAGVVDAPPNPNEILGPVEDEAAAGLKIDAFLGRI